LPVFVDDAIVYKWTLASRRVLGEKDVQEWEISVTNQNGDVVSRILWTLVVSETKKT
jgi:acyl dehydratase